MTKIVATGRATSGAFPWRLMIGCLGWFIAGIQVGLMIARYWR